MRSLMGSCEIVEASEESTIGQKPFADCQLKSRLSTVDRNEKLPVLKLGYKESLEDDINKLFEAISLKKPSKGSALSEIGMSPKMKNVLKKPITVGVPGSPRIGNSDPVNMKQALRDLCISKATEMAAMKRLSKSTYAPATSEAGRIKTLYNAVVGEASGSGAALVEDKDGIVEISLVPEESRFHYSTSLSSPKQPKVTSSQNTNYSPEVSCSMTESESGSSLLQKEAIYGSSEIVVPTLKVDLVHVEKDPAVPALYHSNADATLLELAENILISSKRTSKTSTQKAMRRGEMQTASSTSSSTSAIGNRVSQPRNLPRSFKQVLRNNNLNKKKTKQDSGSTVTSAKNIIGSNLETVTGQVVCEICHCALANVKVGENDDSVISNHDNSEIGVSLSNVPSITPKPIVTSTTSSSRTVGKLKKTTKLKEVGEISQSSKSSQGDHSSSTSTSDDSNASGSSCGNRPHMSKDVRWEAIRQVQIQYGVLGLKHFNLLKKLGSGDIGTVYLAELIGTNYLFAIKVMDNEFLVRRNKMARAQTEREILRMLDHPFLPTLYAQFTSDNLSCLVMEYCPGGDLHVLRQRQLGRSFSEPSARFYVAEVLLALEYLHMLGVIYRDLKPENILIRDDGHIMLTDFDLSLRCSVSPILFHLSEATVPARISRPSSKPSCIEPFCIEPSCQVPCFSPRFLPPTAKTRKSKSNLATQVRTLPQLVAEPSDARSNSFVGTHEYLAPEIIKGEGHGAAVDWWTFGIFLYELLYGRTPFKGSNNEETLANVVFQSLKFPDTPFVSFQARDLIRGLLVKEPENRLGTEKGAAELKQHPFFEGLNWALIRCAVPPEVPEFLDSQGTNNNLECFDNGEALQLELF